MKFYVDTADTSEIRSLAASGLLDGVTTNPSLVAKSGKKIVDVIAEICAIVPGPVSAEVAATDYEGMVREAEVLRKIAKNVTITPYPTGCHWAEEGPCRVHQVVAIEEAKDVATGGHG